MAFQRSSLLLCLFALFNSIVHSAGDASFNRSVFPPGFVFGVASSAYQYEGAAYEGGKGPSIWDTFTENFPDRIKDRSSGKLALNSYNRYKEYAGITKDMGFDASRISVSWSRILPTGKISGGVNQEGIRYYNNLINEILSLGLEPFVTIFHWDLPQALQDEYGGFLSPQIVKDYRDYAELLFREFGDRVKTWITLNEPYVYAYFGYTEGFFPPLRCSQWKALNCTGGDSATEPYLVVHNLLLSHAAAVKVYRDKYKMSQKGKIGITLYSHWMKPFSPSDEEAALRIVNFSFGWFMDPITFGKYPSEMVEHLGKRLPEFSSKQSTLLKGSYDFLGLNYYSTYFARNVPCKTNNLDYSSDTCAVFAGEMDGKLIGPRAATPYFYIYPQGMQEILLHVKRTYNSPIIYITENGINDVNTDRMAALEDDVRVDYFHNHLLNVQKAITAGVDVRGFFAWTLLDDFEWSDGYTTLFGLFYVDRNDGLKLYPKRSAFWFKEFLLKGNQTMKHN